MSLRAFGRFKKRSRHSTAQRTLCELTGYELDVTADELDCIAVVADFSGMVALWHIRGLGEVQ